MPVDAGNIQLRAWQPFDSENAVVAEHRQLASWLLLVLQLHLCYTAKVTLRMMRWIPMESVKGSCYLVVDVVEDDRHYLMDVI